MRLIDADAFSEKYGNYYAEEGPEEGFIGTVGDLIAKQPTIEPEVRHGRWNYRHEDDWCYCTACGTDAEGSDGECLETDYCPHCGAKMDGKFTLGSEANGCWISCAECANTGCKNRYVQEAKEDDKR